MVYCALMAILSDLKISICILEADDLEEWVEADVLLLQTPRLVHFESWSDRFLLEHNGLIDQNIHYLKFFLINDGKV